MNENHPLEDRLEALGTALRTRPSIVNRVLTEARESAANGSATERTGDGPRARAWRRRIPAAVTAVVAMGATAVGILLMLTPAPSVGWAEVVEELQARPWIRGTATLTDGDAVTMWLSPERRIWAYKLGIGGTSLFCDGRQRVKYEHRGGENAITKLPLGEEDAQRVLPVEALSRDESAIGPWLFGEKIVQQRRQEVTEAGKTWIDFKLTLWRGPTNQATLRVDPETRLPVYILLESPTGKTEPIKWEFDYPADGPADIYALGVPRETKIDDQMPNDEVVAVLDAMAASRALVGDFRLTVGDQADRRTFVVSRKGDRWRIDVYNGPHSLMRTDSPEEVPHSVNDWLAGRLEQSEPRLLYLCDGTSVLQNENSSPPKPEVPWWELQRHIAPQDLLTCSHSFQSGLSLARYVCLTKLVYPDLTPTRGWGFEFDPRPADAPDCILIKRSVLATSGSGAHEWFYLDPSRGYAVVRAELFSLRLPPHAPADMEAASWRQTIRMENFEQSPRGFWYPTVVHDTESGHTHTIRYRFEFDVELADSLFAPPEAEFLED